MRLDNKVVELLQCSKTYAQSLIKNGKVTVNAKYVTKNGYEISDEIVAIEQEEHYVARSAYKLLDAFQHFDLDATNKISADIGASTGGFTQVLLEKGVHKVYAIDVGTNQLHKKIKANKQVISMEQINCRYITPEMFGEKFEFVVMDLSFISIDLVLPAVLTCTKEKATFIILLKPQFELGKMYLNKHGIVKDEKAIQCLINEKIRFFDSIGLKYIEHRLCSISGKNGNREYLFHLVKK